MQINIENNQKEIKEHGNFGFPVNVSEESIQSFEQGSFLWHWHPEMELTWIVSGEIEYHVNEQKYILKEGEGLFCNSGTLHAGYRREGKNCDYLSITFHPRFLYGYEESILQKKYVEPVIANDAWGSLKLEKRVIWHQEIIRWMQDIYAMACGAGLLKGGVWESGHGMGKKVSADYELQVHLILMQIWQKLYRYFTALPEEDSQPQRHLQRLRDIVSYIQENYDQEISLDDVADHVNICKSECCRFFKKHMNMTILEYLLFLRIQKSLPMLKAGESVTKTAGLVGFASPSYYGQIFKRYMNCTPKEYQKTSVIPS